MPLHDIVENKIALSLISATIGIALTTIVQKFLSKTARFRYSTSVQRVAVSADDAVFGSMRVTWGNSQVRNLYLAELEIENLSSRDFENVEFKVFVEHESILLNERSSVEGTPYIVPWSDAFKASIAVPAGNTPTEAQQKTYYRSRDYFLKVFNRGQLLRFGYLCTRPNDDLQPHVFVSTLLKGARLFRQDRQRMFYGVPNHIVLIRGLILSVLTVLACGYYLHSVWLSATLNMLVGLAVLPIGFAEYMVERWLRKSLAG